MFELYEGDVQFNSTSFSSFSSTRAPLVSRQSFVFPCHITAIGVSVTERGLTNKDILCKCIDLYAYICLHVRVALLFMRYALCV